MAILMNDLKCIYVDIPKVACSSLKKTLAPQIGIEIGERSPHSVRYPRPSNDIQERRKLYSDFFVFGFVRNPWARAVSCYKDKVLNLSSTNDTNFSIRSGVANCFAHLEEFYPKMPFDAFVDALASIPDERSDRHFLSQVEFFKGWDAEFVGRFENLSNDWMIVAQKLGIPQTDLPTLKHTPPDNYQDYYNTVTREKIRIRYQDDIETLRYTF